MKNIIFFLKPTKGKIFSSILVGVIVCYVIPFVLSIYDVFFVGHDLDEIDGAVDFGLKVIEFNNYLGCKTKAHYKINIFSDILKIINQDS